MRHAVTELYQLHSFLTSDSLFPSDSHLCRHQTTGSPCCHSSFSHHLHPFSYYFTPLHSSFLSVLSFLPANCCCTTPIISLAEVLAGPPLQQLETHVFRPPGCLKKIPTHLVPPVGPCNPTGDFGTLMMGHSLPS